MQYKKKPSSLNYDICPVMWQNTAREESGSVCNWTRVKWLQYQRWRNKSNLSQGKGQWLEDERLSQCTLENTALRYRVMTRKWHSWVEPRVRKYSERASEQRINGGVVSDSCDELGITLSHTCCYRCSLPSVRSLHYLSVTPTTRAVPSQCEKSSSHLSLYKHPHSCIHAHMNSWTVTVPQQLFFVKPKWHETSFLGYLPHITASYKILITVWFNLKNKQKPEIPTILHTVGMHATAQDCILCCQGRAVTGVICMLHVLI